MQINQVSSINFQGYNSPLKTLFKEGKLPTVKKGLYGNKLTKSNCSLEHEIPHSQRGGYTNLSNLALADRFANTQRGNKDIHLFLTKDMILDYLKQFIDVIVKKGNKVIFDGNNYIERQIKNFKKLGYNFD